MSECYGLAAYRKCYCVRGVVAGDGDTEAATAWPPIAWRTPIAGGLAFKGGRPRVSRAHRLAKEREQARRYRARQRGKAARTSPVSPPPLSATHIEIDHGP
jgi:hypothetical protein